MMTAYRNFATFIAPPLLLVLLLAESCSTCHNQIRIRFLAIVIRRSALNEGPFKSLNSTMRID